MYNEYLSSTVTYGILKLWAFVAVIKRNSNGTDLKTGVVAKNEFGAIL
jgi:hypothetical protein